MKRNRRRPRLKVTTGGKGAVSHAGARLEADVADDVGLTDALSAAMAPPKQRRGGHDRGGLLVSQNTRPDGARAGRTKRRLTDRRVVELACDL